MQARRRAQPSGTNGPSSSHPRWKAPSAMRRLLSVPAMRPPGSPRRRGSWQARILEPRGSAPRERDHRGGDHPVPSRTRQLSPPSPRVLQRQAAGGQGVALAEGAFLMRARAPGAACAACAGRGPRGRFPCGPLRVLGHCPVGRFDRRRALGRRFFIFMRPRRGSRARAECPQGGDRHLRVFLYSEAVRCRRVCARASCWTGPVHGMCRRNCVGSLRAF